MNDPKVQQTPPRILVVEDDPFVRDVLDIYLRGEGYEVTLAADGNDMRRVLAATTIHLVIMDLRLPGEDGFALTRYLREQYPVGIIILSTRHEIMGRVVGLECGAWEAALAATHRIKGSAGVAGAARLSAAAAALEVALQNGDVRAIAREGEQVRTLTLAGVSEAAEWRRAASSQAVVSEKAAS